MFIIGVPIILIVFILLGVGGIVLDALPSALKTALSVMSICGIIMVVGIVLIIIKKKQKK